MSLLVAGSVALDSIKTPFGEQNDILGGSATFFSTSASFFVKGVRLVAVVGEDFPPEHVAFLQSRNVDTTGLRRIPGGKTFRWKGYYEYDLNSAHTLETHLNVFAGFQPELPAGFADCPFVFLANIDPELQMAVRRKVIKPKLIACDTMNFWIKGKLAQLKATLAEVDLLIINDAEARELGESANLARAARNIRNFGPKALIVKHGEYGATLYTEAEIFKTPAFPLEEVFDPTGAGDTFAGGVLGYLASRGEWSLPVLRQAMIAGTVMASFVVEKFSLDRLREVTGQDIRTRYALMKKLVHFEDLPGDMIL